MNITKLIKDNAFYYISPDKNLKFCDDGDILTPGLFGTMIVKAYWVKDSPQTVTLLKDVYSSKEKFKKFLLSMRDKANHSSILNIAQGTGGDDFESEMKELLSIKELS